MKVWGLANLLGQGPLDTLAAFSSISAMLGNPGQANYAAANAAMEGAVEGYQAQGLNVTAQGWGPWAAGGMAAQQPALLSKLQQQGRSVPRGLKATLLCQGNQLARGYRIQNGYSPTLCERGHSARDSLAKESC